MRSNWLLQVPCLAILLAAAMPGRLQAGDVDTFGIVKGQSFEQTSTNAPIPAPSPSYGANVFVAPCSWQGLKSARLIFPGGGSQTLPKSEWGDDLQLEVPFTNEVALNAAFPDGSYKLVIETAAEGTVTNILALATVSSLPAPHIANFDALQAVNAASAFQVQWDLLPGGTANDFILFEIWDDQGNSVFMSPDLGRSDALNGTNTSVLVPAQLLEAGRSYQGNLIFGRGTWYRSSQPGAVGTTAYYQRTQFNLRTIDLSFYLAVKVQLHSQVSTNAPTPAGWLFHLGADDARQGDPTTRMTNASVLLPGGGVQVLNPLDHFGLDAQYPTQDAMNLAWLNGTYTFTMKTVHDGTKVAGVSLTGDTYPGVVPHVSNFDAAQAIRADADFVLTWDALSGTAADLVIVEVQDAMSGQTVFASPEPGHWGALNGTSTSVTVPAGSLTPGRTYEGRIIYARGSVNTSAYPGAAGFGAFGHVTMTSLQASHAGMVGVAKTEGFQQLPGGSPVSTWFSFDAFLNAVSSSVTNVVLRLPDGSLQSLQPDGSSYYHGAKFGSKGALEAAYPPGTYTNTLSITLAGPLSVAAPMATETYPATPARITNLGAAQAIDSCREFTLNWELADGTANDFVQLRITETNSDSDLFTTSQPGQAGALNGTNLSLVLPAGTLRPGRTYQASLLFARGSMDTASHPGVLCIAAFAKETLFPVVTSGTIIRPLIKEFIPRGPLNYQISGRSELNRRLVLERSLTLQPGSWLTVSTSFSSGDMFSFFVSQSDPQKQFYRLREQ